MERRSLMDPVLSEEEFAELFECAREAEEPLSS